MRGGGSRHLMGAASASPPEDSTFNWEYEGATTTSASRRAPPSAAAAAAASSWLSGGCVPPAGGLAAPVGGGGAGRRRKARGVNAREAYYASHLTRGTAVGGSGAGGSSLSGVSAGLSLRSSSTGAGGGGVSLRTRSARVDYANMAADEGDDGEEDSFCEDDDGASGGAFASAAPNYGLRYSAARGAGGEQRGAVAGQVVDRVLDSRIAADGAEEFLIKWLGHAHIHNTWERYEAIVPLLGIKKVRFSAPRAPAAALTPLALLARGAEKAARGCACRLSSWTTL